MSGDVFYVVVMGEVIDNQWFLLLDNTLDGLVYGHCDDGQQWPKDLLLHPVRFPCDIVQHSWGCQGTGSRG